MLVEENNRGITGCLDWRRRRHRFSSSALESDVFTGDEAELSDSSAPARLAGPCVEYRKAKTEQEVRQVLFSHFSLDSIASLRWLNVNVESLSHLS